MISQKITGGCKERLRSGGCIFPGIPRLPPLANPTFPFQEGQKSLQTTMSYRSIPSSLSLIKVNDKTQSHLDLKRSQHLQHALAGIPDLPSTISFRQSRRAELERVGGRKSSDHWLSLIHMDRRASFSRFILTLPPPLHIGIVTSFVDKHLNILHRLQLMGLTDPRDVDSS
ncbi:MAG: hypothetical protein CL912_18615 [Deltaproteobacteria bacterium]|nr:hypothetical protein [Deltaproteobacteria bacterium]